jgi:L-alanine-DL-glutamate epimerase-like enolase superfamily enzyme
MKIRKIELYSVKLHLRSPLRLSFGAVKHSKNIILRIHTTDDGVGVAEIAPSSMNLLKALY